jgi:hypothetical protein
VPEPDTLLRIYLNDHLGAAAAGVALARRTLRSNREGELGRFLAGLVREIEEDRASLEQVMHAIDAPRNPVKEGAAKLAERLGRLKLNGRVRGYSDLSRLLELEGLTVGVGAKRALWRSLQQTGRTFAVDLDELVARAERQRDGLEEHRLAAARRALAGSSGSPHTAEAP